MGLSLTLFQESLQAISTLACISQTLSTQILNDIFIQSVFDLNYTPGYVSSSNRSITKIEEKFTFIQNFNPNSAQMPIPPYPYNQALLGGHFLRLLEAIVGNNTKPNAHFHWAKRSAPHQWACISNLPLGRSGGCHENNFCLFELWSGGSESEQRCIPPYIYRDRGVSRDP